MMILPENLSQVTKRTVSLTLIFLVLSIVMRAQNTPTTMMEQLDRGVVALPRTTGTGNLVSWRLLGTDKLKRTTFDVIRNGQVVKADCETTNYEDSSAPKGATYRIVTKVDGKVVDTSADVQAWTQVYKPLKLQRPATGAEGGTYSPNDMSVGDVDGDGQYELFVKWDPSNAKDNSQNGITDNVYLDCYRLSGEMLWRIDLGPNIRAGAHYTQFQVYDYDGDGKAELMCKTAPGTLDGKGNYVSQASDNETIKAVNNKVKWRNDGGRIDGGHEYLTVFDGLTGAAIHTIPYLPNRNNTTVLYAGQGTFNWDDRAGRSDYGSYGNRGERYLAATAFLGGPDQNPSGIFVRGYYTFANIWAVDFDGKHLTTRWLHQSHSTTEYKVMDSKGQFTTYTASAPTGNASGSRTMYGNGNHNMTVGDVDGDGCDEIVWGSAACDHDGKVLYATGYGHGDAMHMADHNPDRSGLEVFQVHEGWDQGWDLHDAATGEILFNGTSDKDNGRGMAAQIAGDHRGSYFSSARDRSQRSAVTGEVKSTTSTSLNFRVFWDGDLQEELLDGGNIDKWNGSGTSRLATLGNYNKSQACNGSKNTPNLVADILGDWREEIILWSGNDNATLNIFTTNIPTAYKVPTLMHDRTYRMGVCWQNGAYNQPPHLGYYLPDAVAKQAEEEPADDPDDDDSDEDLGELVKGNVFKDITVLEKVRNTRYARPTPAGKNRKDDKPVAFYIGDSTMRTLTSGSGWNGQWGFGLFAQEWFKEQELVVENHALGGTSSRTFYNYEWPTVKKGIKPGDFVVISFGHNDGGKLWEKRSTIGGTSATETMEVTNDQGKQETVYTFGQYMRMFIDETRALGATPVLCSRTPRYGFTNGVFNLETNYRQWGMEVAQEKNVAYIDLEGVANPIYTAFGEWKTAQLFYDSAPHTSLLGAWHNAWCMAQAIAADEQNPLRKYLKKMTTPKLDIDRSGEQHHTFTVGGSDTSARYAFRTGYWGLVYNTLEPGDTVKLAFGPNEQKGIVGDGEMGCIPSADESREVKTMTATGRCEVVGSYGWYIRYFVNDIREKGAIPVLLINDETTDRVKLWNTSLAGTLGVELRTEEATAIRTLPSALSTESPAQSSRYNLSGQRVGSAYKGIVIENGRKRLTKY